MGARGLAAAPIPSAPSGSPLGAGLGWNPVPSPSPGQVVTYQFGSVEPFGASFKVTPETTETEVNVRKCFRINGTDGDLVTPQSVFPSLENFKVSPGHGPRGAGNEAGEGRTGHRWAWGGWEWANASVRGQRWLGMGKREAGSSPGWWRRRRRRALTPWHGVAGACFWLVGCTVVARCP